MSLCVPYISLIYAVSKNDILGKGGSIPWKSPEDFLWFKGQTLNQIVVMGRKTWESLPKKPLPSRINIVITHQKDYDAPGALVVNNLYDAVIAGRKADAKAHVFIIGGKALLEEGMRIAVDAWVSQVDVEPELDDTCVLAPELPDECEYHKTIDLFEGTDEHPKVIVSHIKF